MIGHQAPGKNFTDRFQVAMAFLKKIMIVLFIKEDTVPVIAAVVNVINAWAMNFHGRKVLRGGGRAAGD